MRVRRWLRDQSTAQLGYYIAVGALFALGVFFRSHRYWIDPIGLWGDEASWARRLFRHTLTAFDFRPLGYMDATQLAVHIYSNEQTLRILSYVAGLASLAMVSDIARLMFRSRVVRLLCLSVVVFHPLLIDMSREFKPYSVELCAHLGLVWLFLRWRASQAPAWLYALLLGSVLSFLFAYNIVFLYPSIFALLGLAFLLKKAQRSLLITVLAAGAAIALITAVYFGVLRQMGTAAEGEKFWGGKYDVFYLPQEGVPGQVPQSHVSWLAHKYLDLVVFPDVQRHKWTFPEAISPAVSAGFIDMNRYAWFALHFVGLVALCFPGRRQLLVLLAAPLILIMGFNWFGIWPFGTFRANTFLLGYYILIAMVGLDALIVWARKFGLFPALAACSLILLPNLTIGFDTHGRKQFSTGHSEMRSVLRRLKQLRESGAAAARTEKSYVLSDWYSCSPFEFYTQYSDTTRREFGSYLAENFDFQCTRTPRGLQSFMHKLRGKSFFVVVTDPRAMPVTRGIVHRGAIVLDEEQVRKTHDLYYVTGS